MHACLFLSLTMRVVPRLRRYVPFPGCVATCRSSAASLRVVPRPRESELYFHCQTYSSIFIFNQFTALLLHWPNKNNVFLHCQF